MKIAMVFDGLQIGGVERVGADYARILTESGHEVTIINLNPSLVEMESEFPSNCKIVHCRYPRKLAPEEYTQLIKWGGGYKFIYPLIWLLLEVLNIFYKISCKVITTFREEYNLCIAFASHFNDLTFVSKRFINSKKQMCWIHGALYSYLLISDGYYNLYNKIKNLVVLVDDAQEEVLCYNKKLKLNIHKLYNPTFIKDREVDNNKVEKLRSKYGKYLIMVARFDYPHKDHYTVAKALEILRMDFDEDFNLVFLGTGPEQSKVMNYVGKLNGDTKDHVFFLGNQKDVQNYYSGAFALVHASVAGEGLPTIMLEAMAYGLPMVVTDSKTGPREIIRDNEFGLLCRVQDPKDMADKIIMLCKDEELYSRYRLAGKIRIKDFDPKTIRDKLNDILIDIMSK